MEYTPNTKLYFRSLLQNIFLASILVYNAYIKQKFISKIMIEATIKQLIQENLENCWRQMAKTRDIAIQKNNVAVCIDSGTQESLLNSVISFSPSAANLAKEVKKLEDLYAAKRIPFCWWIPQGPLFNNIDKKLTERGFGQTMEVKGMALDFSTIPLEWALPENMRIVQATTPQHFSDWMGALRIAFDMEKDMANWYKGMFEKMGKSTDTMLCYIAYYADTPVSALTLFLDKKVASFYNVGTIPDFRQKGLTTAMTHYCLDIARKRGYTWATLQANSNSVRLYNRMGFNSYTDYRLYFK